ncbi:MAG: thioesterase family protein [Thermodesulforhabdaceae bacterium]
MGSESRNVSMNDFPFKITLPVLWGHMDAFQHVNNVIYFRYLESARIAYFEAVQFMKFMEETGVGPILAETSCRYLKPLRFPDTIDVGCRTSVIRDSEIEQDYAIYSHRQDRIVATGWALIVAYNYKTFKRAQWDLAFVEKVRAFDPNVSVKIGTE